jgi:asparagine synthase (glutamine-hydrolysing)
MCGIAGFAGEDSQRIERMVQALQHRGPDGNAVQVVPGASLGHARLAILDPRPIGDQPMWNADKTLGIVFNGEIFNFRELKERERIECKTGTDTEVVLKLYEKHGMSFVPRLKGMFAFGIYDTRSRTWYLARDESGIKPLYLAYPNGKLHFASEMRSLMSALPRKPELDLVSLSRYLRLQYVPGPRTMCEGIESLPPGTILTWHEGQETRVQFTADAPQYKVRSKDQFKEEFPLLMDTVVKDHLVSDKPIGIFLSGGMDSSIVLHHMCNHAAKPVRTFTVRFAATEEEGAKRFNADADLATLTAKHYGTDHQEVLLTAQDYNELYWDTARSLDQPNSDAVSVAQFLLSRHTKKKADVVLTGAGGDELFGGYPRYRIARILDLMKAVPAPVRGLAGSLLGHPRDVLTLSPGPELAERLLARPKEEWADLALGLDMQDGLSELFRERFKILKGNAIRQFMEFDRAMWLVDESLRLTDATTMGSGLEGRVPFLDPRIIAYSHGTPAAWGVTTRRTKALLKDAYRPLLPNHLYTLKKASFYPPLAKWIRREASPLVERMLDHPRIKVLFDTVKLRAMFEAHKRKEAYHLHPLMNLTQLAAWFDTVYDA